MLHSLLPYNYEGLHYQLILMWRLSETQGINVKYASREVLEKFSVFMNTIMYVLLALFILRTKTVQNQR